jgi:hypothetical protein
MSLSARLLHSVNSESFRELTQMPYNSLEGITQVIEHISRE